MPFSSLDIKNLRKQIYFHCLCHKYAKNRCLISPNQLTKYAFDKARSVKPSRTNGSFPVLTDFFVSPGSSTFSPGIIYRLPRNNF